jgi:hypothetical protein
MLRVGPTLSLWLIAAVPAQDVPEQLRERAYASRRAQEDLIDLCDRIGGRLTGSPAHFAAAAWVEERALAAGLRVRKATVPLPATWSRGPVRVLAHDPAGLEPRVLAAEAAAWAPATAGARRGPLLVDPRPGAEVEGRIVLVDPAALRPARPGGEPFAGAACVLIDGQRPFALVPTGLAQAAGPFVPSATPAAFVSAPDAAYLRRRVRSGAELEVEVVGGGSLGEPLEVGDLFVELPGVGAEGRRDEIVLCTVALDSWDVGRGALDDGAGVAVALEAARLLAGLDGRTQRSVRFAFLAGQAQGLGTTAYAGRLDAGAVARHVGGFALEGGGGRLLGLALDGAEDHLEPAERWFAAVRPLGFTDIGYRPGRTAVTAALRARGVPFFALVQEAPELAWAVGTAADTPDRVVAEDLQQAACVLATGLHALAEAAEAPPRLGR